MVYHMDMDSTPHLTIWHLAAYAVVGLAMWAGIIWAAFTIIASI